VNQKTGRVGSASRPRREVADQFNRQIYTIRAECPRLHYAV